MASLIGMAGGLIGGGLMLWGWPGGSWIGKVLCVVWMVAFLGVCAVGFTLAIRSQNIISQED